MKERKRHNPEQKVLILRELLENNVHVSQLAEKYGVHPTTSTTGNDLLPTFLLINPTPEFPPHR